MGMYKYLREKWKNPKEEMPERRRRRLTKWRKEEAVKRVERPTRIERARNLGYKSKQGFVVARARVSKGSRKRKKPSGGRRSKRSGRRVTRKKSKQRIAEERTSKKFPNLRVLNSYWVGEDGKQKWYEVILVDPEHPAIRNDDDISWISDQKERALRGKTSSGKGARSD